MTVFNVFQGQRGQRCSTNGSVRSCIVHRTVHWQLGLFRSIDTECNFWFNKKKILDSTNGVSSKSMESHLCACAVECYEQTVSRNLKVVIKCIEPVMRYTSDINIFIESRCSTSPSIIAVIIGASLSKPYTSELNNAIFINYMYYYFYYISIIYIPYVCLDCNLTQLCTRCCL